MVHTSSDDEQNIKSNNVLKVILDCITPDQIRGFPKAQRRKVTRKPRTQSKSSIISNTPDKIVLLEELVKKQTQQPKILKLSNHVSTKPKDGSCRRQ